MDELHPEKRVMLALNHCRPDRVPLCDGFWGEFVEKWRTEKGLGQDANIYEYYGLDVHGQGGAMADQSPQPSRMMTLEETEQYRVYRDGWGRTLKRMKGFTTFEQEIDHPIQKKADFDNYEFESPDLSSRYEGLKERVATMKEKSCVFFKTGGPYSRTVRFRGTQQFLLDMALDASFVQAMVNRMTRHLIATMMEGLRRGGLPETAVWVADDIAGKNALLFSPTIYESIFYPALKKMCAAMAECNVRFT